MFKSIFGSINNSIIIMVIVTTLLAVATLFEREYGADMTLKLFYHSWWIWSLLTIGVATAIYQVFVMRKLSFSRLYSLMIHGSFVFIICGALITHFFSQEAFVMLRKGEKSNYMLNERQAPVGQLPFSVMLNDFTVERYGGAGMPSNYISDITIIDGNNHHEFLISMNNIVRYGEYKLYQSSYDGDEQGSVLMINDDYWGSLITYIGYTLLMLGMGMVFFSKQSRFKDLLKKLTVILVLCSATLTVQAQSKSQDIKEISTIAVQAASGRIEPFAAFASNVIQKIYKDRSYNGVKSEVIIFEMLAGNTKWQIEPIIKLESESIQKELNKNSLYVTYREFFMSDGRYILADRMNKIYEKKQDRLTRTDKEFLKLDERINIIYQLYSQMLPEVIPIAGSSQRWMSLAQAQEQHMQSPNSAMAFGNIITLFNSGAKTDVLNSAVEKFTKQQTSDTVVENRVSRSRLVCEAWYGNFNLVFYAAILVILMGVMGFVTFLISSDRNKSMVLAFEKIVQSGVLLGILALTFNVALRWYVAGRVPMSNSYETVLCVAWTLLFCGWLFRRVSVIVISSISFVAGCFLMISYVGGLDPQITPLVPILNSHWLLFHVATIAVSYGLFALSVVMGIIFMILKIVSPNNQNIENISTKMTALNELSQLVGVLFLTTGIFLGAIWANVSWGRYWGWDPKETWALITMFAYVINIHLFISKKYYSKYLINLLSIFTIWLVLMTFFGVNYFFGGMHAYGGEHSFPIVTISGIVIVLIGLVVIAKLRMKNGEKKREVIEKE